MQELITEMPTWGLKTTELLSDIVQGSLRYDHNKVREVGNENFNDDTYFNASMSGILPIYRYRKDVLLSHMFDVGPRLMWGAVYIPGCDKPWHKKLSELLPEQIHDKLRAEWEVPKDTKYLFQLILPMNPTYVEDRMNTPVM